MNKLVTIIISLVILLGCKNAKKDEQIQLLINGDWVIEHFATDWKEKEIIFSFRDSTCSYLYPFGEYSKYNISSDTLIIHEKRRRRNGVSDGKEKYQFTVLEIDEYKLSLIPITKSTLSLFKNVKEIDSDTIRFRKIKTKNKVEIKRIGFYSTGCYGPCPSMYLEIDSSGMMLFNGRLFTDKDGMFSGSIPKSEFKYIESKVQNIQLEHLKKRYMADWTDDQTCGVKIITDAQEIESSAYGFDKEPVELRILFHNLMEVYKAADLQEDTSIIKKYLFQEFQHRGYPPPPPPPPIEN